MASAQCVVLHGKLYVGGGLAYRNQTKLFITSDLNSWTHTTTPASLYALTTYHSQLVLVGGIEIPANVITNKLWVRCENGKWNQSLPPMPTKRKLSSAFNTGGIPDYMVIAGGVGVDGHVSVVEVLVEEQWSIVQSLPELRSISNFAFHNGNLCLVGGLAGKQVFCYCRLVSLLDSVSSPETGSLWGYFDAPPMHESTIVSFGRQLILVSGRCFSPSFSSYKIHAYSPFTQSWVQVGDMPSEIYSGATLVLPTGELVSIGGYGYLGRTPCVYKASLKGKK